MPLAVTVALAAAAVILGIAITVWFFAPAFQGAEAARRDLGSHRLEFGAIIAALVLITLVSLPAVIAFHLGPDLTTGTFIVTALATDVPLFLVVYLRLILPGALTWTELGLKPIPVDRLVRYGVGAGLGGLVVIDIVGSLLSQIGLRPNQLEQFEFVQAEGLPALIVFLLVAAILAPFVEEVFFRGFLFGVYRRRQPLWLAYVVSSVLFTLLHLEPNRMDASQMAGLSVGILLLALLLAWVYQSTGSLFPGMLAHAVNNAAAVLLFYAAGVR